MGGVENNGQGVIGGDAFKNVFDFFVLHVFPLYVGVLSASLSVFARRCFVP